MAHRCVNALWIGFVLLASSSFGVAGTADEWPLEPWDLSSPRATLKSFLSAGDRFYTILHDEYWSAPSRKAIDRLRGLAAELERMLELSALPPAARFDLGRDGVHYLYEVLSRIQIPPEAEIPDAAFFEEAGKPGESNATPDSWTIPHTEITLIRAAEGPQAGRFLFSGSTVARAGEFYRKTRDQAYRRDVPLRDYVEKRHYLSMSGWIIPAQVIERFPEWLKQSVYGQAVWKWLLLLGSLAVAVAVITVVWHWSRRGVSDQSAASYLRRLSTPLALLLIPAVLDVANQQLTLVGAVSGTAKLLAAGISYLAVAWIIWTGSIALAEAVIASPKISERSLNAHLLRLVARAFGIIAVISIVFRVSSQIGLPLYGVITGLGLGGLAVALAIRPTLENILGGLILFTDRPVRIGDYCRFGDEEGTVEDIGLRSTRVRKRDETLISIPNADFIRRELHNYTRRRGRLYETTLGLRYETSVEQLRYVMVKLREMLNGHPKVSPTKLHVRFQGFGSDSLDIVVSAYIRTRDKLTYLAIREDINLRIMDIVRESGTGFAFPSRTLYLGRDTGIDIERGHEAEKQVEEWRSNGQLPFPEFDEAVRKEQEDILDYPPKGSPDYSNSGTVSPSPRNASTRPSR